MKEKINKGLLRLLSDNILLIVLAGIIGGLLVYYIDSNNYVEQYKATAKIYVSNEGKEDASYNAESDLVLAKDCSLILANRTVMMQVIVGLDLQLVYSDMKDITAEDLQKKVNVCVPDGSRIIYVTVRDKSPARAKGLADAIAVAGADYLKKSFGAKYADVVENANMPVKPIKHSYIIEILCGVLAGFVVAILIMVVLQAFDKKVKNKNDFEKIGIPVLASIPMHEEVVVSQKSKESKDDETSLEKEE